MINKNLPKYATERWGDYIVSVTEASKSQSGTSLVTSDVVIYCFDDICKSFFSGRDIPTSADGLQFPKGCVELVEFKSGFKQRITKEKFDPEKGTCKKANPPVICADYWETFWALQDKKKSQLIESIRAKAIESYILLEKHILPLCEDLEDGQKPQLVFTVVVDEDGVDGIEDTLAELAEVELKTGNSLSSIRQALKRLVNRRDANGLPYLYDRVEVLSAKDFENRINCA